MISVLCPSRGRPDRLYRSTSSLLLRAARPQEVEILVALDPDDEETPASEHYAALSDLVRVWVAPERYGYFGLHHYVNHLAGVARGDWLMLWNDDALMKTEGWDDIIRSQSPSVLWLKANHDQGGNLFPAWPRSWSRRLGHVSLSPNIDVWVSEVGRRAGAEHQVPVEVFHDRPDITGSDEDETFREGRAKMGQWNDPGYDSQESRAVRARDVKVITRLLAGGLTQ